MSNELLTAAANGKLAVIEDLLNKGADVNFRGPHGLTALHYAARFGETGALELLIQRGADISAKSRTGRTPFLIAVIFNQTDVIASLICLSSGSCFNDTLKGRTAFMLVAERGCEKAFEELLNFASSPDDARAMGCPPRNLMRDLNQANAFGYTPLMFAALGKHFNIARSLIENNARLNSSGRDGYTAFLLAAYKGATDILQLIAHHDIARLRDRNNQGSSALLLASRKGHIDTVKWLLESGLDVNSKNFHNDTALLLAIEYNHTKLVELLVDLGADITHKNNQGFDALDIAKAKRHKDIIEILNNRIHGKIYNELNGLMDLGVKFDQEFLAVDLYDEKMAEESSFKKRGFI